MTKQSVAWVFNVLCQHWLILNNSKMKYYTDIRLNTIELNTISIFVCLDGQVKRFTSKNLPPKCEQSHGGNTGGRFKANSTPEDSKFTRHSGPWLVSTVTRRTFLTTVLGSNDCSIRLDHLIWLQCWQAHVCVHHSHQLSCPRGPPPLRRCPRERSNASACSPS